MPIHPAVASKFHLLERIESFEAEQADPVTRPRMDEFMSHRGAPPPPAVDVRADSAPGPHGPVPVRVYRPTDGGTGRPALVWLHGGAFVGVTWTCRRRTGSPGRPATGPARSSSASTTGWPSAA